jgi:hypothetical protein
MSLMKKIIFLVSVSVCLLLLVFFSLSELDETSASYENYSEVASTPGLFDAGWIPIWLPKSAFNIQESHNVDTNESWLMFNYIASDKFYMTCALTSKNAIHFPSIERVGGFPDFVAHKFGKLQADDSLTFYECEGAKGKKLALNNKDNTAYVWGMPD